MVRNFASDALTASTTTIGFCRGGTRTAEEPPNADAGAVVEELVEAHGVPIAVFRWTQLAAEVAGGGAA